MLEKKPSLVSIIIPTHNRVYYLQRAVESVLKQSYINTEILIIDDSTFNDTIKYIKNVRNKKIKYTRNKRTKGPSGARNTGIDKAKGDYIAFLDDDDLWMSKNLEVRLKYFTIADIVVCQSTINGNRRIGAFSKIMVKPEDLKRGFAVGGGASVIMGKAEIIKKNLFDESLRKGEDWDFLLRVAREYKVLNVRDILVDYNDGSHERLTNKALMNSLDREEIERRLKVVHKHKEFLGPYWFNYHVADNLLSYFGKKRNRAFRLLETVKLCGFLPVAGVLGNRVRRFSNQYYQKIIK